MTALEEYIRRMRERAEQQEKEARETTTQLCMLNNLMVYKNASAHIPVHLRENSDKIAEEVIRRGSGQSDVTEGAGDGSGADG